MEQVSDDTVSSSLTCWWTAKKRRVAYCFYRGIDLVAIGNLIVRNEGGR